jgi:hypothetical protein
MHAAFGAACNFLHLLCTAGQVLPLVSMAAKRVFVLVFQHHHSSLCIAIACTGFSVYAPIRMACDSAQALSIDALW